MQNYFYELADHLGTLLRGREVYTCVFRGEDSDFVRFNRGAVRQAMHVAQRGLRLRLVDGSRHARSEIALSGDAVEDRARAGEAVAGLREIVALVPEDPYLLYAEAVRCTERIDTNRVPAPAQALEAIHAAARGCDFVGLYAAGGIHAGFANSLGQRNWFSSYSHNLDFSLYQVADKAVKARYAGYAWDDADFHQRMEGARAQLGVLGRPPRSIEPGRYRVYLSPSALSSLVEMIGWGGFGLKSHRTRQTALIRMVEEGARLHPGVTMYEDTEEGVAAGFQEDGFLKPDRVALIRGGEFVECLASPRSAREYGVPTNGACEEEEPESLDMAPGRIPRASVLRALDRGMYIDNLWYLNFSDRPACRITGMTRFATFWVEGGEIVAPLNVMRFDETIYHALGDRLIGLTEERDFILDEHTFERRSTASERLPGALVEEFEFTL